MASQHHPSSSKGKNTFHDDGVQGQTAFIPVRALLTDEGAGEGRVQEVGP